MSAPVLTTDWLAAALISYETDEPHYDDEDTSYYPPIDIDQFREWLELPHDGDCEGSPHPCRKCFAHDVKHKAEWLIEQAVVTVREGMDR